jgi:hypothetical protein
MANPNFFSPMSTKLPDFVDEATDIESEKSVDTEDFDPIKHLAFVPPAKIYTMEELDLPKTDGVSPVAVSDPFPLFTQEAIQRMRAEIMSNKVWENCQYSSNLAQCQLRGFAAQ